jgi:hypothetical protein
MDQKSPSAGNRPGLNPRDALDILDIRTSHPQGATELASRSDAGADVLQYLAVNGACGGGRQYQHACRHQPPSGQR